MAMRTPLILTCLLELSVPGEPAWAETAFRRGDFNGNGSFDIADPVALLLHLFAGAAPPGCRDAGDADDGGFLDIADAVYSLEFLFLGGPAPGLPYPECGDDPTADEVGCADYLPCSPERNEIAAIRAVNSGVEIELTSTRAFPVRALPAVLCIGGSEGFFLGRFPPDGSLNTMIFILSREEFAQTRTGDQVTVQHGFCGRNLEDLRLYWDLWVFGPLDKSLLKE